MTALLSKAEPRAPSTECDRTSWRQVHDVMVAWCNIHNQNATKCLWNRDLTALAALKERYAEAEQDRLKVGFLANDNALLANKYLFRLKEAETQLQIRNAEVERLRTERDRALVLLRDRFCSDSTTPHPSNMVEHRETQRFLGGFNRTKGGWARNGESQARQPARSTCPTCGSLECDCNEKGGAHCAGAGHSMSAPEQAGEGTAVKQGDAGSHPGHPDKPVLKRADKPSEAGAWCGFVYKTPDSLGDFRCGRSPGWHGVGRRHAFTPRTMGRRTQKKAG